MVVSELPRQRPGELRQSPFRHLVSNIRHNAPQTRRRGNQNDGAFLLAPHIWNGRPAKVKNSINMHLKRGLPRLWGEVKQTTVDGSARRVHEHVHWAEPRLGFSHATGRFARLATIGLNDLAAPAQRDHRLVRPARLFVQTPACDGKFRPFSRQSDGAGRSNTPSATGHQCDLST